MINQIKILFFVGLVGTLSVPLIFAEEKPPAPAAAISAPQSTKAKTKKPSSSLPTVVKYQTPTVSKMPVTKKSSNSAALEAWLKKIKDKLSKSQTKNNRLIAVAAVRGAETKDAPPLYWKGLKTEGPVNDAELKDFDAALEAASNGDKKGATEKFQTFVAAYPKSPMVDDAKETLDRLAKEPATSANGK